MKKHIYFGLILLLFSNALFAQYAWHDLPNAPKSYRLDDMFFLNPKMGWAVSPDYNYLTPTWPSGIYMTKDGGDTWETLIDSVPSFYRSIGFVDSLTGWVGNLGVGSGSTADTNFLYQTNDGGHTWNIVNVPGTKPAGVCGIFVVNDSTVYVCGTYYGPARILKTTNKGASWTNIDMSTYAHGLVDMHFTSPDSGFVIGSATNSDYALILRTTDGGATWTNSYLGTDSNRVSWKIVFPSKNVGYVTIEDQQGFGPNNFLKTVDGGSTWQLMPFPNSFYDLQGIGFINDSVGWIGGDIHLKNFKTTDGGLTWNPDNTFGKSLPPANNLGTGSAMNRFRRFGDTLMYASGNTVYKYAKQTGVGIAQHNIPGYNSKVHPNPFSQNALIEVAQNKDVATVLIYNAMGQVRKTVAGSGSIIAIDRTGLDAGLYFYKVITEKGLIGQGKLIIE